MWYNNIKKLARLATIYTNNHIILLINFITYNTRYN